MLVRWPQYYIQSRGRKETCAVGIITTPRQRLGDKCERDYRVIAFGLTIGFSLCAFASIWCGVPLTPCRNAAVPEQFIGVV